MKTNRREFIKSMNWALAGIMGLLGFAGCKKEQVYIEYGSPPADYTVKGKVVNKANRKPIEGIRVGYDGGVYAMYGVPPAPYGPKASVTTNAKGEFKLTDRLYVVELYRNGNDKPILPVYVNDITNGLFQSEILQVGFSNATQSRKPQRGYGGEYTVNLDVELTEIDPEIMID